MFGNQNAAWTGRTEIDDRPKLKISGNHPYFLMHHPLSWEMVKHKDKFVWVPQFSQLSETPGVNGVEDTPQGPDSRMSRIKLMEGGYTFIERGEGYLTRYPTTDGAYYYCNRFCTPKIIGDEVFWNMDLEGWNEWRLSLLERGIVAMPEPEIIQGKQYAIDRRIDRRIKMQHIPEVKTEIEQLYALKGEMVNAYEAQTKPKKGRKNAK